MLRRQSLIALGIAVILGLVAVFLANTFLTAKARQDAADPAGMTRVAVAAMPLAYGSEVTPDKIRFAAYPTGSLPPGTYRTLDELMPMGKRRVALRPIQVNQPLLAADLTGEGQAASIAALLPDGMRAATVRINDVSGVAGFVKPNDTVDVLITRQAIGGGGAGRDEQVTDVLLQNIRVIAMDQNAQGAQSGEDKPEVSRTATLEVAPVDAQKLALGQQLGQLSLVLRKPGEEQNVGAVQTVSLDDLRYNYYGSRPPQVASNPASMLPPAPAYNPARRVTVHRTTVVRQPAAPRAPPKPAGNSVEVLRGTKSSTYEVGGYAR